MRFSKTATAVIAMIAMIAPTAACGTDNASSDGKTEITVWAWDNNLKANAKQFMKDNPDIKVTFANAGSSKDEYVALSNAIEAGSGAPDIAQIEYYAIPEYAIKGALKDLTDNGAGKFKDFYTPARGVRSTTRAASTGCPWTPAPWRSSTTRRSSTRPASTNRPPHGRVLRGRQEDPRGRILHHQRPRRRRILQCHGLAGRRHPYSTSKDGKTVTVNLTGDPGVRKFTKLWQKMIDEDLIETKTKGTSDDWYRAVGSGEFAGVITAAWAPGMFLNQASEAPASGASPRCPHGRPADTRSPRAAAAPSRSSPRPRRPTPRTSSWRTRSTTRTRSCPGSTRELPRRPRIHEERQVPQPDHHGQHQRRDRRILRRPEIQRRVRRGRQERGHRIRIPPYDVYARSIFTDTVGAAYMGQGTLMDGVKAWQAKLVEQGRSQGFTVKEG